MRILFLLYPTSRVKVDEDSSFWIMNELVHRGHEVHYFESKDLVWKDGVLRARWRKALLHKRKGFLPSPLSAEAMDLNRADILFIRKEPPFDREYLYALQLLSPLKENVFILNDPDGIARCNEKLFILEFQPYIAETLVTCQVAEALRFAESLGKEVVVKPLDQKAGTGIFKTSAKAPDVRARLYAAMEGGSRTLMVQRYLPQNAFGDKRILVLNGEVIGAFLRRPSGKDFRANLSLGGTMHRASVTTGEKKMVEALSPKLLRHGLYFVGLDVIGGYLSEINVTSPSGIPEIKQLNDKHLEKKVVDFMERYRARFSDRKR